MTGQQQQHQHKEPSRFENKLTRYFDDFLNDVGLSRSHGGIKFRGTDGTDGKQSSWTPAIDIRENDREYVVIADVPGVAKEDLDVELHETLLVISGQNKQDPHDNTAHSQKIGVDKDNQSTGTHHQQPTGPQHHQQPTNVQQPTNEQPTSVQQPTNVQQSTGVQQPSEPLQYQGRKDKQPEYQQDRKDKQPYQPSQPGEQQYHQKQDDRYQQQQPNERYPQDDRYQQQPDERRYQQPDERRYQQQDDRYQQPDERRYQQSEEQTYQHIPKHNHRQQTQGERVHIQERPYGYFSRTIQLPNNIKADDDFYANLSNGVLKIKIPKSNDRPKKKITIS